MAADLFTKNMVIEYPLLARPDTAAHMQESWQKALESALSRLEDSQSARDIATLLGSETAKHVLDVVFANSPFLSRCTLSEPLTLYRFLTEGPEACLAEIMTSLDTENTDDGSAEPLSRDPVMARLRRARRRLALVVALADILAIWDLDQVTAALSAFADRALERAIGFLLLQAAKRGELALSDPEQPTKDCGYVVLAMGKQGARELNYSSDIDLIVLFDPAKVDYRGSRSPQECFVRLTRDLVLLLEERTKDGYVFRTDLRLRPDPAAMPLAISYTAAMTYYESMGQNWERAAMIKARPAAGDLALGDEFLKELRPFIWRKNLDFWAIQDVHSIKRQIHSHKGGGAIALAGHNIKLGRGGIREIEFFVQTQQLIYGGRAPALRTPRTREALKALTSASRIDEETALHLDQAYLFLRRLEHRLQMIEDQQTHSLPKDTDGLEAIAAFMAYPDLATFHDALFGHLRQVEKAYAELFEEAPTLSGPGNLVFTGGEPESETLQTLQSLGFEDGDKVFALVRAWHHGRHRATRSTRSRELLTELMPNILSALGRTSSPDDAVAKFDEFLGGLPAGVQLFSLIHANPWLLDLLAEIMGTAPALADHLSRKPGLLDAVLSVDFFAAVPDSDVLSNDLANTLEQAKDFEDVLDLSRRWANDRRFQVGVHILRGTADLDDNCQDLSNIADTTLSGLFGRVRDELGRRHGFLAEGQAAVLALGKLGSREMTVTSDLDLIFLYDKVVSEQMSDGDKPLAASQYYGRLGQRFINALTVPTAEGQLYKVDMRLRPSGNKGPIASSLKAFTQYQNESAWTWEHMALTRARVVFGDPTLTDRTRAVIQSVLTQRRDPNALLVEVDDMRARIEGKHSAHDLWQIKHIRGGLIDLEFLVQYLQLRHGADCPDVLDHRTLGALDRFGTLGILDGPLVERLRQALRLFSQIQMFLRLTTKDDFEEASTPEGLKSALAQAADLPSFAALKTHLMTQIESVDDIYQSLIAQPAIEARARIPDSKNNKPGT